MSPVPPAANKSKRRKFRPKKGRLQSAGVSNMMESLEETERRLSTEERMREVATEQNKPEPTGTFNPMPKSVGSILKVGHFTAEKFMTLHTQVQVSTPTLSTR